MNNIVRIFGIPILLFMLLSGYPDGMADTDHQLRVASALFGEFETVFRADVQLLSNPVAYNQLPTQDANSLRIPFAYLLGALDSLGNRASGEILDSGKTVFVGVKNFHPPAGLGSVRSEFCYVVTLKKGNLLDPHKYFAQLPATSVGASPVWNWSAKLGEYGEKDQRPSSLYAIQVARSYFIVSNDIQELQIVAEELTSANNNSRVLAGIREWKYVNQHQVWGYRRYRSPGVENREAAGMSDVAPEAQALVFVVDLKKKAAVLRLLSSPKDEHSAASMAKGSSLPPLKSVGTGLWETVFPLAGDDQTAERLFYVMGSFGFGTYL